MKHEASFGSQLPKLASCFMQIYKLSPLNGHVMT